MTCTVLYEDNHLLAVNKPPGTASAHEPGCMLDLAKSYLKTRYNKPGNVYLGLVHRLDKPVSGVLLFARTSKAAARISEQFRKHSVLKTYLGLSEQPPRASRTEGWSYEDHGLMEDWLWHDDASRVVKIVPAHSPQAQDAVTEYRVLQSRPQCLLQLTPRTGRRHQLRVQLASRGAAIIGDRKYGSTRSFPSGIALHAFQLAIHHPISGERLQIQTEPPAVWLNVCPNLMRLIQGLHALENDQQS